MSPRRVRGGAWHIGARVALSIAILGGTIARASESEYVGAESCRTCHEAQYQQWRTTGHALAFARLSKREQRDRTCRSCHSMVPLGDDPALEGVQCESCHGAGSLYAPRPVMRDAELRELLGLDKIGREVCEGCHTGFGPAVVPFDYEAALARVRHSQPAPRTP